MVKYTFRLFIVFIFTVFWQACGNDKSTTAIVENDTSEAPLFRTVDPSVSKLDFTNQVNESTERNSMFFDYFLNGGGVAVGDVNNDGLVDIFFTGNDVPNRLYINEGELKFRDVTKSSIPNADKWSTGVNMVDINQDGWLDIFVCNSGMDESGGRLANQLLINNGDLTFTDQAEKYGITGNSLSVHSTFFDYDNDGDLDLWVSNHLNYSGDIRKVLQFENQSHQSRVKYRSTLYRNDNGKFTDVTETAGVSDESVSLGVITMDLNNDDLVDIYVSNDYDIPDRYYVNNGDGTFSERSKDMMGHTSFYSMGVDAGDLNNDGAVDLVTVDMTPQDHVRNKTLMASMDSKKFQYLYDAQGLTRAYMYNSVQVGRGGGQFSEIGNFMGASQTEWSWAPLIADFDNDGFQDLYITNGYLKDTKDNDFKLKVDEYRQSKGGAWNDDVFDYFMSIIKSVPVENRIFQNQQGRFTDVTAEWSDLGPSFSNGAAYADFDNDGDLDIIVNNLSQSAALLENTSMGNNYLRVKLKSAASSASNARISISTSMGTQSIDYTFSRGFQSSVEQTAHFGLGKSTSINGVKVKWGDSTSEMYNVNGINKTITLTKGQGSDAGEEKPLNPLFTIDHRLINGKIAHSEMRYDDFKKEVLLPHKFSDLGPALAVGDLNGDGVDDVFLGGSNTSESQLLLSKNEKLRLVQSLALGQDKRYEDLGAEFFDYDGDGDLDLYVASGGGGEIENYKELTQDRLYENDGKGNFTSKKESVPPINSSTKAIAVIDADKDGDYDLIVGGRNSPGNYPLAAKSYYLENSGSYFRNKSKKVLPELPDMITDIAVVDLNEDGWDDILVTSEWDSPKMYINNKGIFEYAENGAINDTNGWWQSVTADDIDGDGDIDFILGNIGENNKFHPSKKKPLGILASDFDDSGSLDIVLTKKYNDETVPVRGKECSSQQMPLLKEKFPTYEGFATSSIEDILGAAKIEESYARTVTDFASYLLINNGSMDFTLKRLPQEAQWFPVMDAVVDDFDNDGRRDIFLVGNKINAEPETPSYDAGRGLVLMGTGGYDFKPLTLVTQSGVDVKEDARAIKVINSKAGKYYIVASNNSELLTFRLTQ